MSWMIPYTSLDAEQRAFLQDWSADGNRNYWIKGFAGSGKSVLLVHALIQEKASKPDSRVCVVSYTHSLIDMMRSGIPPDLGNVPVVTPYRFAGGANQFDLVLVDEVQDLEEHHLRLITRCARRVLAAGDSDQSIYDERVTPAAIRSILTPKEWELTVLHRMPPRLVEIANALMPEKRLHAATNGRLRNVDVQLTRFADQRLETSQTWAKARSAAVPGKPAAILLPKKESIVQFANDVLQGDGFPAWDERRTEHGKLDFGELNQYLDDCSLPLRYLGNGYGDLSESDSKPVVFLMTYHSAKGLDFESVFLPSLNATLQIWRRDPMRERTLFYVALTRSRLNVFLSHTYLPHPFVEAIPSQLVRKSIVDTPPRVKAPTVPEGPLF